MSAGPLPACLKNHSIMGLLSGLAAAFSLYDGVFIAASAAVGCRSGCSGVRVSIGLPSSDASASRTFFMSPSGEAA